MRHTTQQLLACAAATLAIVPAFAQSATAPKLLNTATAATSVTAPAIAWPVVYGAAMTQMVHMAPGATEPVASPGAGAAPAAAEAPPAPPAQPTLLVDVDLSSQRMTISEDGMAKYTWAISSARAGYRTPTGTFKPTWMSKMWYSRQYDMAPMPHAVFFSGGVAIHATYATGMLGNPASHGCVRLAPKNAATFFSLVSKHGKDLTRITVHGVPRGNGPAMASNRRKRVQYAYVQAGYFGYGAAQPYGQQQRPTYAVQGPGKKQKFAQGAQVIRTSGNGFGYGFGGF